MMLGDLWSMVVPGVLNIARTQVLGVPVFMVLILFRVRRQLVGAVLRWSGSIR